MKLKYIIACFFVFHYSFLWAQTDTSISKTDTIYDLQKEAIEATELCYNLSKKFDDKTVQKCEYAVELSKKAGIDSLVVLNLSSLVSKTYLSMGASASYEYVLEEKEIAEASENQALKMPAYYDYSLTWERHTDIENAVNYLNKALEISYELDDKFYQARLISGIGYLFIDAELYEDSKKYFMKALEIAKTKDDSKLAALMQIYLAVSYRELDEYEKSEYLYYEALKYYATDKKSVYNNAMITYGLAKLEAKRGNYETSNKILLGKDKRFVKPNNKSAKEVIASNYYKLGNYNKSLAYYNDVMSEIDKLDNKKLRKEIYRGIADCYLKLGQYENASNYYQKHADEMDIYMKEKLNESIATAELRYKLQTKDAENKYLTAEKENLMLQNRIKSQRFIGLIGILALFFLILVYVYRKQKNRNKFLKAVSSEQEKINEALLTQSQRKDTLNQELKIRNQELSSFAGIVAHDIKSPIRTTSGFIQLIRKHIKQDDKLISYLSFIEKSNQKLSVLIDDLLAFTRSGKFVEATEMIDMNEIIQTVKNNIAHQIAQKSAEINVEQLPLIQANESALTQLFQNIIANSIKFTKNDIRPIVEITTKRQQDYRTILIKDNGIGIKQAYLNKIFDPLTKLHTDKEFEGSGLGLATCKRIIEHLGGTIEVESELGEGSIFKIHFPSKLIASHTKQNLEHH